MFRNLRFKIVSLVFLIISFFSAFASSAFSQNLNLRTCIGLSPTIKASRIENTKEGDINLIPCFGRSVFVNGAALSGLATVQSVSLVLNGGLYTVSNPTVTTAGSLTASLASQTQNTIFAAPNGSNGAPVFRSLVDADIPVVSASKIPGIDAGKTISGIFAPARFGTGSPTSSTFLRGDNTWSALLGSDIPNHSATLLTSGQVDPARSGTGTRDGTKFLRDDGTWQSISSGTIKTVTSPITSATTLTESQSGQVIQVFNTTLTLPANPTVGVNYLIVSYGSSAVVVKPNSSQAVYFLDNGTISALSTTSTQYSFNGAGVTLSLVYVGNSFWSVYGKTGNWTFTA